MQHAKEFTCLKGVSSWLTVLPVNEHGFSLHKSDFCNAMHPRYDGHCPIFQQSVHVCGASFNVEHNLLMVIQLFATMRSETLLHHWCLRCILMCTKLQCYGITDSTYNWIQT